MKKVLLVLLLVAAFGLFGVRAFAEGEGTGNLVIHFKAWDENYTELGSWAWGGPAAGKVYDGLDDFGAYWEYNDIPVGTEVGFIAVIWPGGAGPNWDAKLTGDVKIDPSAIIEGQTTHVYVFEGAATNDNNPAHFIAQPDKLNMLVVYFDSTGSYEEKLGVHAWGWVDIAPGWGDPYPMSNAGKTAAGVDVKALMLSADAPGAGLLVYAGDDATKKTGDVKLDDSGAAVAGDVGIAYVVGKGDAYTAGDNVFYNDYAAFAEEAFSFKLMAFDAEAMSGTYAVDPQTIIVKTSAPVASPYPTATDKDAARAIIESWFTVVQVGTTTPLAIERVDFASSNTTLNQFVVILEDEMDNTKEYELFFNLNQPEEALDVAKQVAVTLNVTVPANTPAGALLSIAGNVTGNGWTPGLEAFTATQVGTSLVYTVTFDVEVKDAWTTFEYKWTRGSWDNDEFVATNRPLVIPNNVDSIVLEDEVEAWKDIDAPDTQYAAPERKATLNVKAAIILAMDTEAPEIQFISPTGIVGKTAAERIIEVAWGVPFNQNSFPRFRATDDRDGDLTSFVFVPKGDFSVLNTAEEGDYTIMLQVSDKWGNVTQETFIFRVVKK